MTGGAKLNEDIPLQDEAPSIDALTVYDEAHMAIYLQLLYGDATGQSLDLLAEDAFGIDAAREPERARKIVASHIQRAKWMCRQGARHFSGAS
jgi:hypothetical protein